ncbi:MAG: flagellar hook-associated protein FlgK [Pseudomonadales bacterium]|nr:flagellar hook-associated protein FlgK [Pseudomonadales bacterium]
MSLLNIGVTGLKTQQAALNVVGQNITNAATPGYTRQRADLETIVGSNASGLGGAGVRVGSVTRIADAFIDEQVRTDTSLSAELESFADRIGQLESSVFDARAGIDASMRDFFASIQDAANEPSDLALRDFVLNNAQAMTNRFQGVAERTWLLARDSTTALESATARVNELSTLLVDVNDRIASMASENGSSAYNALLDQRELLLKDLSSLVSVSTIEQGDGQMNVFIGKGQPLVLGQDVARLEVTGDGDIALQPIGSSSQEIVTSSLTGGEMGGLLRFREEVLFPTQNEIGRLAAALSIAFNEQHELGVDLDGKFGKHLFRDVNDAALVGNRTDYLGNQSSTGGATASVNVYIDDPFAAEPDDYIIRFSEENAGSYTIQRKSDGALVQRGTSLTVPQEIEFEGLRVEFASGTLKPGDTILVRPYGDFAQQFDLVLSEPGALALASPVLVDARGANEGDAGIRVQITDSEHPVFNGDGALLPPLLVEFLSDTEYVVLDNSDPGNPVPLQPDLGTMNIVPGAENHLLPFAAGSSLVSTSGPAVSAIETTNGFVSDFSALGNGYPSGMLTVAYLDSVYPDQDLNVTLNADASAAEIAAQLSNLPGVKASATTEVQLSGLTNQQTGTPVELTINGVTVSGFTDLAELADTINDNENLSARGIYAKSDGQTLSLTAQDGSDLALHFQGDPAESITLTNAKGESLTLGGSVPGSYSTATVGGVVNTVLDPGLTLTGSVTGVFASEPVHARADLGFDAVLTGAAKAGDRFDLVFNAQGVADNRNALAMGALSETPIVGDPPRTFAGVFGGMIQSVGIQSAQAQVNREAAESLLAQSESFRESVSGVNLDEEAANLIRHEQAYNAAAQVISIARDIFNVLLNSVS